MALLVGEVLQNNGWSNNKIIYQAQRQREREREREENMNFSN